MTIKRVLIVDDSPTERHVLNDMLTKAGYEVVASDNGEDAILKAKTARPDLILMDVVMPRMNGFDACRRIRSGATTSEIPVIMVTTRGELESVEAAYESGCAEYVIKPIDAHELLAKVQSYLGESGDGEADALPS